MFFSHVFLCASASGLKIRFPRGKQEKIYPCAKSRIPPPIAFSHIPPIQLNVMFKNRNLLIIALIMLTNSLGYGIMIPILYTYSIEFGLSDFENGMLLAVFSLCQFIATPFIGRLSDKYGRKPLLIISIGGTALSLFMTAFAPTALFLFLARALDGITSGNIPVASAVISDTTKPEDRAKGFGIIWASFGFGFVFGPTIAAVSVVYGLSVPFIIAGLIASLATLFTWLFLPETNTHIGEVAKAKIFDLKKMAQALIDENTGVTFLISFVYSIVFGILIFAFQPFAVKQLHLSAQTISLLYTMFGVIGLVSQLFLIHKVVKRFGEKATIIQALFVSMLAFAGFYFTSSLLVFVLVSVLYGVSNALINPVIQAILSKETDAKSQGSVMGLNQAYVSLGMTFGPIIGGLLALISIPLPFLFGSVLTCICLIMAIKGLKKVYTHKVSEF